MIIIILLIVAVIAVLYVCIFHKTVENYRDPIYLNRDKLEYDWYPRTSGSIYGMPLKYGGNHHLFSGINFNPKAY